MKPLHQVLSAAGLVVLGAIAWQVLTVPKPQAGWLQVEAPARVAPGETATLRVTLPEPDGHLLLIADLHGWTGRNHPLGAVSHANPQHLGPSVYLREFLLPVPTLPDLATVRAVIYLSPTGSWEDHVRAAVSDEIPVKAPDGSLPGKLTPLPAHDLVPDPVVPRVESAFLRHLIVGLWLVVAFALGLQLKGTQPDPSKPTVKASTFALVTACLAVVLIEILGAEQNVGDFARQYTQRHGLYEERHLPQQVAVLLTVVGVAAVMLVVLTRARRRWLVCGLLVYAAISITATLSLHETDVLLYTMVLGLPVEQLGKLIAVGLSLWGLRAPSTAPA